MLFRTVASPTSYSRLFPKVGGSQPHPKFNRYYLRKGQSYTEFKFDQYILRVYSNKSPLKILEKRERGRIQKLPKSFKVSPIISETGTATNFEFCTPIQRIGRNKSQVKISGKLAEGVLRNSRKFSYIGRIARSS